MSEFKGTRGPWSTKLVLQAEVEGDLHVIHTGSAGGKGFHIAYGTSWIDSPDTAAEAAANARLIAAAPDLLAALIDMVSIVKKNTYPTPDKPDSVWGRMEVAESAISKATGE
ncbi:hypothetical protein M975_1920 [Buttiauxella brennerae ATCC 51605]|uniref:Uncharacterized protein n=1 Tax=Buttiauxella brennerae ATCC 51605 TaxID=1354251 RepID=A0A1B7IQN0_9ENTR|nr:hypothetical protein [Buttiauxella brennerae]OAT32028.1 hypothetical protein M975_1920 [Buttiauxella brennerae ATCC 51605]